MNKCSCFVHVCVLVRACILVSLMLQSYVVVVLMLVCYKNVNVRRTNNNGERKSEHDIVARLWIIYKGGLTQRHAFGKYYYEWLFFLRRRFTARFDCAIKILYYSWFSFHVGVCWRWRLWRWSQSCFYRFLIISKPILTELNRCLSPFESVDGDGGVEKSMNEFLNVR